MFGYLPSTSGDSLKNLLVYMAFPAEIKFDSKGAIQSSWSDMKQNLTSFITYIFILGMCFSVLLTFDYKPYEYEEGPALMDIRLWTCYSWKQLVNNALIASEYNTRMHFITLYLCNKYPNHTPPHSTVSSCLNNIRLWL